MCGVRFAASDNGVPGAVVRVTTDVSAEKWCCGGVHRVRRSTSDDDCVRAVDDGRVMLRRGGPDSGRIDGDTRTAATYYTLKNVHGDGRRCADSDWTNSVRIVLLTGAYTRSLAAVVR